MSLASFGTVFTVATNRQLGSCVPFTTTLIITLMSVLQLAGAAKSAPAKDNANEWQLPGCAAADANYQQLPDACCCYNLVQLFLFIVPWTTTK